MEPVVQAVRQRGICEAAVSSRGSLGHAVGLEKHDVAFRVCFFGVDRRPQAGEAAAHDQQIGALVFRQGRARLAIQLIEPEAARLCVGQCEQVGIDGKPLFAARATQDLGSRVADRPLEPIGSKYCGSDHASNSAD